jgi:hypothetical protein
MRRADTVLRRDGSRWERRIGREEEVVQIESMASDQNHLDDRAPTPCRSVVASRGETKQH